MPRRHTNAVKSQSVRGTQHLDGRGQPKAGMTRSEAEAKVAYSERFPHSIRINAYPCLVCGDWHTGRRDRHGTRLLGAWS